MWYGYIDPGSGTIILQAIVAAGIGVAIFFRDAVKRVIIFLFVRKGPDSPPTAAEEKNSGDD